MAESGFNFEKMIGKTIAEHSSGSPEATLRAYTDWSTGSGPVVKGPLLSLLIAMTGRTAHLDELAGDGLAELRSRI